MSYETYKTTKIPYIDALAVLKRDAKERNIEFHRKEEMKKQEKIFDKALQIHSKGDKDIKRFWRNLLINEIY